MIGIISSIIIAIGVLVITLITFNPNVRVIMEDDFMRTAKNNAYLNGWEQAQLNVRTGNLNAGENIDNISLGYLSDKKLPASPTAVSEQKLKADISFVKVSAAERKKGKEDYLSIQIKDE